MEDYLGQSFPKLVQVFCGYFYICKEDGPIFSSIFQDLLLGSHYCFDVSGGLSGWGSGQPDWGKKCCSNEAAPVRRPPDNIDSAQLEKVSFKDFMD